MPNPWDITSWRMPVEPDTTPSVTYEAVGRATSAWETLEINLGRLYALFVSGDFDNMIAARRYGENPTIFRQRMDGLEGRAETYFRAHPNQKLEGAFEDLACRCRKFSLRRHDIAHGIVHPIDLWERSPNGTSMRHSSRVYCLFPPHYDARRYPDGAPAYAYTSKEMGAYTDHFYELAREVTALSRLLSAQPPS
jgi:hypothetical protein